MQLVVFPSIGLGLFGQPQGLCRVSKAELDFDQTEVAAQVTGIELNGLFKVLRCGFRVVPVVQKIGA